MSDTTYYVRVTIVKQLTPGFSTFSQRTKFCPAGNSNSCPSEKEWGTLTQELSRPADSLDLGRQYCHFYAVLWSWFQIIPEIFCTKSWTLVPWKCYIMRWQITFAKTNMSGLASIMIFFSDFLFYCMRNDDLACASVSPSSQSIPTVPPPPSRNTFSSTSLNSHHYLRSGERSL
jgi:hypothetical protein